MPAGRCRRAGSLRTGGLSRPTRKCPPRTGGGHLARGHHPRVPSTSAPHARGSTWTRIGERAAEVCPARAGVNRCTCWSAASGVGLPRTRGGQPGTAILTFSGHGSAPHTRGSTLPLHCGVSSDAVCPAHAGANRWKPGAGTGARRVALAHRQPDRRRHRDPVVEARRPHDRGDHEPHDRRHRHANDLGYRRAGQVSHRTAVRYRLPNASEPGPVPGDPTTPTVTC